MSFTTFSGPLRSGTVRQGTVASGMNAGTPILAQTATVSYAAMTTSPTAQALFVIPAGAKIVRFDIEVVTAISGGSVSNVGVTIGSSATANKYMTSINTGLTSVKVAQATSAPATSRFTARLLPPRATRLPVRRSSRLSTCSVHKTALPTPFNQ